MYIHSSFLFFLLKNMWKVDVSDAKKNVVLEVDGQLLKVIDVSFMQMQQRQWSYTLKVRNLITGWVQNITYKSGTTLDQAEVMTKNAIYLYNSGDMYSFMENDTGEIQELHKDAIADVVPYLKENLDLFLMMYKGNVLSVILPTTITYTIVSTVPGVKWDRAQAGRKPATLETWLEVSVPLYRNEGDSVTLNTITNEIN